MKDPPLFNEDGKPIYLSEHERLVDQIMSTGKTTIGNFTIEYHYLDFNELKVSNEKMNAIQLIQQEQERARDQGYSAEHDENHEDGVLAQAGTCYAEAAVAQLTNVSIDDPPVFWPWDDAPELADQSYLKLLIKGAAMIASEIDKQLYDMGVNTVALIETRDE